MQEILNVLEILSVVLDVFFIVPEKVTVWDPTGDLYPENAVGVMESETLHEEISTPFQSKSTFAVKVIPELVTAAPFPIVKKIFIGPSELLAFIFTAAC